MAIDVLINNAGLGDNGRFADSDPVRIGEMLQVNIGALTELARLFLPGMIARRRGRVMLVASTAGFQPGPAPPPIPRWPWTAAVADSAARRPQLDPSPLLSPVPAAPPPRRGNRANRRPRLEAPPWPPRLLVRFAHDDVALHAAHRELVVGERGAVNILGLSLPN